MANTKPLKENTCSICLCCSLLSSHSVSSIFKFISRGHKSWGKLSWKGLLHKEKKKKAFYNFLAINSKVSRFAFKKKKNVDQKCLFSWCLAAAVRAFFEIQIYEPLRCKIGCKKRRRGKGRPNGKTSILAGKNMESLLENVKSVRCKKHKTKLNVLCGKSPHVAAFYYRIWCILLANILEELRIKNPSSSIYNLVHLKRMKLPFLSFLSAFRVKVLERERQGPAGHAKNSLGRHYLRSRALW